MQRFGYHLVKGNLALPGRAVPVCPEKVKVSLEFLASGGPRESLLSKVDDLGEWRHRAIWCPWACTLRLHCSLEGLQAALPGEIAKGRLLWFVFPSAR